MITVVALKAIKPSKASRFGNLYITIDMLMLKLLVCDNYI